MLKKESNFRDPEQDPSISDVESEEGFLHIDGEDIEMTIKQATIMFNDDSKLRLFCNFEGCDSKLDAYCIAVNCKRCRVFDGVGNELDKMPYDSELLPRFIKRVWASKRGKKRRIDDES